MSYVDEFIVAVPEKNVKAYRTMAKKAGKVWREHGALDYKRVRRGRREDGEMDLVPQREDEEQRDGRVLLHRLQVARAIATAASRR